jgi:hypothetical protein
MLLFLCRRQLPLVRGRPRIARWPIAVHFPDGSFPLFFRFVAEHRSFGHVFALWFGPADECRVVHSKFSLMLTVAASAPFPAFLVKIFDDRGAALLPNDAQSRVLQVRAVSPVIWCRRDGGGAPDSIATPLCSTLEQAVSFWRMRLAGGPEAAMRHGGREVLHGENLAHLESSRQNPIELLILRTFVFRVSEGQPDSDTVREASRRIAGLLHAHVGEMGGCHRPLWRRFGRPP